MRLIVDIEDELYEQCKNTELTEENEGFDFHIIKSVANGTPLPKGHGRLIEVTEQLERKLFTFCRPTGIDETPFEDATMITDNAPTIIEADRGS